MPTQPWKSTASSRFRRSVRWTVAILVSGVAAWLGLRQVRWGAVATVLARADVPLAALGMATVLATIGAKAVRWHLLLRRCSAGISGWRMVRVLVVGQLGNSFLPMRLGDLARAALVAPQTDGGAAQALGTIAAEKVLDGVAGMFIILAISTAAHLPAWLQTPAVVLAVITALLLALLVLALGRPRLLASAYAALSRRLPSGLGRTPPSRNHWGQGFLSMFSRFGRGMTVLGSASVALRGLALSGVVWGLGAATNYVLLRACDADVPLWANLMVLATVYLATFLPAVPAQFGVFEYACILALGAGGLPADTALAFGLLLHVEVYAPPAVLGPIFTAVEGLRWSSLKAGDQMNRTG
jgi:uncharacterized protein (TIRG00374 family)